MSAGALVPASGGTEQPFTVNGRRWLYCWDTETKQHCYLDLDNDIPVWNRSFHPAWAPQFEHAQEELPQRIIKGPFIPSESFFF
ncbi:hypothetical protein BVZ28_13640 [Alcaligenes faecalis]|uniref:Uncharacterized protein n=1 Tax=Alcaligenes faecalis TaxID=511 RepID=A0A1Z3MKZ0_ALCFA|nr:hypothetical protein [Alcaligenes faecalis]ASD48474.1 hypothetical protein [Alcaligenes faecalis]OSZ33053.1 hypothetical protein BVZ28_13640 [Alcaligenes faecalis]OSZ36363.1 hypothetical protein BVZ29_20070 [Alcaligenes faecalis]RSE57666.1 hypothetical protein EGT81_19730 [Alcaligenes faecalis]WHQ45869.1 hypothetical protein E8D21_19615 [Alcaligenes faecalis]